VEVSEVYVSHKRQVTVATMTNAYTRHARTSVSMDGLRQYLLTAVHAIPDGPADTPAIRAAYLFHVALNHLMRRQSTPGVT